MVGRSTRLISLDVDFFRTISSSFSLFSDAPIGICQYTVSLDVERRRNEDMVDAAFGKTVRVEVVESSVDSISEVALLVRIAEDAFADKCVVDWWVWSTLKSPVRIAGNSLPFPSSFIFPVRGKRSPHGLSCRCGPWRLKNRNSKPVSLHLKWPQLQIRGNTASHPLLGMSGVSDNQKSPFSTMSNLSVR